MRDLLIVAVVSLLLLNCAMAQATLQVPSASFPTIQLAIDAAQSGDIVEVLSGVYAENLLIAQKSIELRAAVRGTVVVDGGAVGSCIIVANAASTILDGLELTNGVGGPQPLGFTGQTFGGGLWVRSYSTFGIEGQTTDVTMRFCTVQGNTATTSPGVYCESICHLTLEDCAVHSNVGSFFAGVECMSGPFVVRRTTFENSGPGPDGVRIFGSLLDIEDSSIIGSTGPAMSVGGVTARRCRFVNNNEMVIHSTSSSINSLYFQFYDCLIQGNGSTSLPLPHFRLKAHAIFSGCTIIENVSAPSMPMIQAEEFALVAVDNCIIRDNGGPDFAAYPMTTSPLYPYFPPCSVTATNSCLSASNVSGPGNIAVDPQFVDRLFGDFRLQVGSPCVDAGDQTLATVSTTDLTGGSRVLMGDADMGCYEARSLAHHPASVGRVGLNVNGPFDLLAVNGSFGGVDRTVTVGVGTASVVTMATPPTGVTSANFVIFGLLGEATAETVTALPFGIGDMMFAPQPMVPAFLHWLFFTYTDNFNPASPQFAASTATPWSSGIGPAIPFPITLTLQGVIEESPGVFVTTNAILFKVQ